MLSPERGHLGHCLSLVAIVSLCVLGPGCTEPKQDLVVRKLLVDVDPGAAGPGGAFDRETIRQLAKKALVDQPAIRFEPQNPNGAVMRVRSAVQTVPRAGAKPKAALTLAIEIAGRHFSTRGQGERFEYRGRSLSEVHGSVAAKAIIATAISQSIVQAMTARSAQKRPVSQLISWLKPGSKASAAQRKEAVILLGSARDRSATGVLIGVLGGDDPELAQSALASLTLIADPKAVDAVIKYSENKPNLVRRQAIDAVRVMGTKKGIAWLFTLSTGHPDADIRRSAKAALDELDPSFNAPLPARVAAESATRPSPKHAMP